MRYCEASAKDNFNVDEIFLKLVDDILSKVEPEPSINVHCPTLILRNHALTRSYVITRGSDLHAKPSKS